MSRDLDHEIRRAEAERGKTVAELADCPLLASTSFTIQEESELRKARRGMETLPSGLFKSKFEYAGLESVWHYKPKTMELSAGSVKVIRSNKGRWRRSVSPDRLEALFPGCVLMDVRACNHRKLGGLFVYPSYDEVEHCLVLCYVGLNRTGENPPLRSMLFLGKNRFHSVRKFSNDLYDRRPENLYASVTNPGFINAWADPKGLRDTFRTFGAWADRIVALVSSGTLVPLKQPRLEGREHYRLVTVEELQQIEADEDRSRKERESLRANGRVNPRSSLDDSGQMSTSSPEVASKTLESVEADLEALKTAHETFLTEVEEYRAEMEKQLAAMAHLAQEAESRSRALSEANEALRQRASLIDEFEFPTTPSESLQLAKMAYPDRLYVHPNAEKSVKKFQKGDAEETWQLLRCVATVLYGLLFSEESVDVEGEFKQETNFGIALNEGPATTKDGELMRLRQIEYRGRTVDISPHVKGRIRKPDSGLRIHFHADHDRQLIVIGHCGYHMPTPNGGEHS